MGPIGYPEMVFIFVLALLLFGPKKLPELGRTIGKAWTEFNRAKTELKATFEREMRTLERETESIKEVTNTYYHDSYNYDYASSSYEPGEPYAPSASDHNVIETTPALESSTAGASVTEGAGLSHTATEHTPLHAETLVTTGAAPEGTIANGTLQNHHHDPSHAVGETTPAD
jgi:sec-independent protein translocase protein TatA